MRSLVPWSSPDDLARALTAAPDALSAYEVLSFTHRKEYVAWVESAKRSATRSRRIEKTVEMLEEGRKAP
ncbi:MAG: YdeI/OmpD-associated family protein [Chloroflexota bacterium]